VFKFVIGSASYGHNTGRSVYRKLIASGAECTGKEETEVKNA
jgi:hypothetical protein